jgi:phage shock protein E
MKQLVVDTREPFEYDVSHVDGAINIPPTEFMTGHVPAKLADIDKNSPIILYSRSGQRSNTCGMILRQFGFTNIINGTNEHHVKKMLDGRIT